MELLNKVEGNILDEKVEVSMTVREVLAIWSVFGEMSEDKFKEYLRNTNINCGMYKELIDAILGEGSTLTRDLYETSEILLNKVLW